MCYKILWWAALGVVGPPYYNIYMPMTFEGRRWDYLTDSKIWGMTVVDLARDTA